MQNLKSTFGSREEILKVEVVDYRSLFHLSMVHRYIHGKWFSPYYIQIIDLNRLLNR